VSIGSVRQKLGSVVDCTGGCYRGVLIKMPGYRLSAHARKRGGGGGWPVAWGYKPCWHEKMRSGRKRPRECPLKEGRVRPVSRGETNYGNEFPMGE